MGRPPPSCCSSTVVPPGRPRPQRVRARATQARGQPRRPWRSTEYAAWPRARDSFFLFLLAASSGEPPTPLLEDHVLFTQLLGKLLRSGTRAGCLASACGCGGCPNSVCEEPNPVWRLQVGRIVPVIKANGFNYDGLPPPLARTLPRGSSIPPVVIAGCARVCSARASIPTALSQDWRHSHDRKRQSQNACRHLELSTRTARERGGDSASTSSLACGSSLPRSCTAVLDCGTCCSP